MTSEKPVASAHDTAANPAGGRRLFDRWVPVLSIALPVLYSLTLNWGAIGNPPAWDSATTVSPAALTIVDKDFDIRRVVQLPGILEGGPSTHATSLYTIGLAGLLALFGPETGFLLAHVSSILLIGGLTGATFLLGRERLSIGMSGLVAAVVGTLPLVLQQSADIYLDLPLAVVTTLAVWTTTRRKFWATVALVVLGVAIKTSGVFLIPLLLMAKSVGSTMRKHLTRVAVGGLLALIPLAFALMNTDRFQFDVTWADRAALLRSSATMLAITVDVFLILAVASLVSYGRLRARSLDRVSKITGLLLLGFILSYLGTSMLSGTIAVLPRYYLAVLPAVLVIIPRADAHGISRPTRSHRFVAIGLLTSLLAFSVANRRGDYYPLPDHPFYVLTERSTRAQDLLQLQIEGTRQLAATGLPVVVGHDERFRLTYPDMGYVSETPDTVLFVLDAFSARLPDSFAVLVERRFANPLVDFEEALVESGAFDLSYTNLRVLGFESDLIVATRLTE